MRAEKLKEMCDALSTFHRLCDVTDQSFLIGDRLIGPGQPPFIIAEMSGNHNQSLDRAFELVDAAAQAGAHAIKLQTLKPDSITLPIRGGAFDINDPNSLWSGETLHDLYSKAETPWEWHQPIMDRARSHGMLCFSSPFDEAAVDFLESLDVPAFKIASFENNHIPLIQKAASTGKPLIISTGLASLSDLDEAVQAARSAGCKHLILLKCTSTYPASPLDTNIATIPHLKSTFNCTVGLSDHTIGVGVSVAAVALGASVIEKHFTLDRNDGGIDSSFSMEPSEFHSLVSETMSAWQSLGSISYGPTSKEEKSMMFRRSIYVSQKVRKGEPFTNSNLRIIRPGLGAAPRYFELILGKCSPRDYEPGTPLKLSDLIEH